MYAELKEYFLINFQNTVKSYDKYIVWKTSTNNPSNLILNSAKSMQQLNNITKLENKNIPPTGLWMLKIINWIKLILSNIKYNFLKTALEIKKFRT